MDHGLHLTSVCNVAKTEQMLTIIVKQDIKEEQYDDMIAYQDGDEKPITNLNCKTETNFAEDFTYHDEEKHFAECKIETGTETNLAYSETPQTVKTEVKNEEDEEELANIHGKSA